MSIKTMTMDGLRALIDRQLAALQKARDDAREIEAVLQESLGEFMQRVAPAREPTLDETLHATGRPVAPRSDGAGGREG